MNNMKTKKVKNKNKKQSIEKTRKQLRKEQRQQKKIHRLHYHSSKNKAPGRFVLASEYSEVNEGDINNETDNNNLNIKKNPKINNNSKVNNNSNKLQKQIEKEKRELQQLKRQMQKHRKVGLQKENEKEDAIIKRLEKQLKLNKRKHKTVPKSFKEDGLDYLLDFCDDENRKLVVETEKQWVGADNESDFEQDVEMMVRGEAKDKGREEKRNSDIDGDSSIDISDNEADESSNGSDDDDDNDVLDDDNDQDGDSNMPVDESGNDDDGSSQSNDEKKNHDNKKEEEEEEEENAENNSKLWEDIYGRKRDSAGNVLHNDTDKYIPPAVRLKQLEKNTSDQERLSKLKRQLKGLLNRLAEFNMHTIASQLEDLYMSNSRNDMNELLSALMFESIVAPVLTPDRLIAEHMALIAILHANVGTEVGAHFLLTLVRKFDEMSSKPQDTDNKQLDNLILMLSHMYNFKIYASQLVYQILEKLIDKFTEIEIECILLILKAVGFRLRKDNPTALKELVLNLQQKAKASQSSSSRVQFMMDIMLAIKNNNMSKIPNYDPSHVEYLKKILKSFLRKGNTVVQLNISLADLLKANERGKWWIVGSAWTGTIDSASNSNNNNKIHEQLQYSEQLLELARKQRMNTDIRRNIFCILMTAEDYLDAFEKLHHLGLKDHQQREIVNVVMKCCLQEKIFNLYYAVLMLRFCNTDRKYQMTVQYSLWDKLKNLSNYNSTQICNLSKFLTYLLLEKGLPLSVLKVIQFGELDKATMRFVRQTMLGLLLHDNIEACVEVFERISVSPHLQTLREGLRLFINHFLLKNTNSKSLKEAELQRLKEHGQLVDKILYTHHSKIIY